MRTCDVARDGRACDIACDGRAHDVTCNGRACDIACNWENMRCCTRGVAHVIGRACDVASQVAAPQSLSYNGLIPMLMTESYVVIW